MSEAILKAVDGAAARATKPTRATAEQILDRTKAFAASGRVS